MNILLSSYSVNPYHGSEDGTGWNWALQVASHFQNEQDRIYLLTKRCNEKDTRRGIAEHGLHNVELIISDVPDALNWYREKHSVFHHFYYILWQRRAYRWVKRSPVHFDIIHHVTMGDFRIPGKMWKCRNSYTIFGPVGGGQSTPKALKDYEQHKSAALFREGVNRICPLLPSYRRALRSFDAVYAVNAESQALMETAMGKPCERLIELAPEKRLQNLTLADKVPAERPVVLYMGRLIGKKGIMLLLDVVRAMPQDTTFEVQIYGNGPLEETIAQYIQTHSLDDKVTLCGTVDHDHVSAVYQNADIFVMPSLRETGGNVIVEAMAHALPVMALDMSISRDLNRHGCGAFVNTDQSRNDIIQEFADKLLWLLQSPEDRKRCGENGYRFVNETLSWENKFNTVYRDFI